MVMLAAACAEIAAGTHGTVVEVYPGDEFYLVEFFDAEGEQIDVVDCPRSALVSREALASER
jgi:hypothetical protein